MNERSTVIDRTTRETEIRGTLDLDGTGNVQVETGLGFLDHMIHTLAFHAGWDLVLTCRGDLHVDDHHTVEDCFLSIGEAIDRILGDRSGIVRFAHAFAPLDEALARVVVDVSGRPAAVVALGLQRESIGGVACENLEHAFRSLAVTMRSAVHVDVLRGDNDHHRAEAAFKACALALRTAFGTSDGGIRSTKGSLS